LGRSRNIASQANCIVADDNVRRYYTGRTTAAKSDFIDFSDDNSRRGVYIRSMIERLPEAIAGNYDNREEYCTDEHALAKEIAESLKKIDKVLLLEKANEFSALHYSGNRHAAVTELALSYIEAEEEDMFVFAQGDSAYARQLVRKSLFTEAVIRTESYPTGRKDALSDVTEVTVEQFVEDVHNPFISKYTIEQYYGGSTQTYVQRMDVIKGVGLDERQMLPYDLREFQQQIAVIAAIRKYAFAINGPSEDEYEANI